MDKPLSLQDLALRLANLATQTDPEYSLRIDLGDGVVKTVTTSNFMIDDGAIIRLAPEKMMPTLS